MTAPTDPSLVFRPRSDQEHATDAGDGPRFVAIGEVTGGEFGLFEIEIGPGGDGALAHYHTTFTESFYVLEGRVRFTLGNEERVATEGAFAFVPRHGVHGFTNDSAQEPARMLILFTPGVAREDYFREMIELHRRQEHPTAAEVDAVAARYDQVNLRSR